MAAASFMSIASRPSVVTTAIKIALFVGTALVLINHAPALLAGSMDTTRLLQIGLTYLVPYGVSTYSSVVAIRHQERHSTS